jgi:hypothetical protein
MPFTFITSNARATFNELVDSVSGVFSDEPYLLAAESGRCAVVFQTAWCALWLEYQNGEG